MPKTFLFYDIETSGLSKCFDQVVQFAAIRTDLSLHELDRYEYFVTLNPDTIPSPYATITHRIGPAQCAEGLCEYDAIKKIHALLNTPDTISLGYNTLGFDDEFLRFSFYKNLLSPYTHQYANGCGRMDLFPLAVLYHCFDPDVLRWPTLDDKVSFKLEKLNAANQLATGQAHNAMVDIEASVALAKKLMHSEKTWRYAMGYFNKRTDGERLSRLQEGVLLSAMFGSDNHYRMPVLSLGQHQHYRNQTLWLRLDDPQLTRVSQDNVDTHSMAYRKRLGEPPILLPPHDRYLDALDDARLKVIAANKQWLSDHPHKQQLIIDYHQQYRYPDVPHVDLDALLYQRGFPTQEDQHHFRQFHMADPVDKLAAAENFPDEHYREQAYRLIGRNYPEHLQGEAAHYVAAYLAQVRSGEPIVDYKNETRLTPAEARHCIDEIKKTMPLDEDQRLLLETA